MNSRQSQESSGADELSVEKMLELDLRLLVSKGSRLNVEHCRELRVLPTLKHVIVAAGWPSPSEIAELRRSQTGQPGPIAVRDAVDGAISRLIESDNSNAGHLRAYGKVLRLLFGFASETRGAETKTRWKRAMEYFETYANFGGHKVTPFNAPKIAAKILYPPLVETLLSWEQDLCVRRDPHSPVHPSVVASIVNHYTREYWWLFRFEFYISDLAESMDVVLLSQQSVDSDAPPIPASVPTTGSGRRVGESFGRMALDDTVLRIAQLWHMIKHEGPIVPADYRGSKGTEAMRACLRFFQEQFEFSPREQEYLESLGSHGFGGASELIYLEEGWRQPMWRITRTHVLALAQACDCFHSGNPDECSMHSFIAHSNDFTGALNSSWLWLIRLLSRADEVLRD